MATTRPDLNYTFNHIHTTHIYIYIIYTIAAGHKVRQGVQQNRKQKVVELETKQNKLVLYRFIRMYGMLWYMVYAVDLQSQRVCVCECARFYAIGNK